MDEIQKNHDFDDDEIKLMFIISSSQMTHSFVHALAGWFLLLPTPDAWITLLKLLFELFKFLTKHIEASVNWLTYWSPVEVESQS